jgi:hypothetical protein
MSRYHCATEDNDSGAVVEVGRRSGTMKEASKRHTHAQFRTTPSMTAP